MLFTRQIVENVIEFMGGLLLAALTYACIALAFCL